MSRKARVFAGISRRPGNTAQAAIEGGRQSAAPGAARRAARGRGEILGHGGDARTRAGEADQQLGEFAVIEPGGTLPALIAAQQGPADRAAAGAREQARRAMAVEIVRRLRARRTGEIGGAALQPLEHRPAERGEQRRPAGRRGGLRGRSSRRAGPPGVATGRVPASPRDAARRRRRACR